MTETPGATPPAAETPPATPPAAATPPVPPVETVTLPKAAVDQLTKDAARAAGNQRKADLYDKHFGSKGTTFRAPAAPATPPSPEEQAAAGRAEDDKATRGLMAIAADPAFREVLDADPTLRNLLTTNPLAALPLLAPEALDADDALGLVKEALKARVKPAAPVTPPATPPTPPTPPAGGVNPPSKEVNERVEAARKLPGTENAIAGMVGARIGKH